MRSEEGRWLEGLDERTERERMEEATTAPERLDDADRELLAWDVLGGASPSPLLVRAVERIVARHVARAVAEARAEALREAADAWTQGEWANHMVTASDPAQIRIGTANRVGEWLRDRAGREGQS